MDDQTAQPESSTTLPVETVASERKEEPPCHKSSVDDTCENSLEGHKRKKGRRKSGSKKHRAGKNRKRKYKPYHRLTFAEREKVDERNAKRNDRKRQYLHSCGVPLAPPNTNQFLFEDRNDNDVLVKKLEFVDFSDLSSLSEYDDSNSEGDDFNIMWTNEKLQRFEKMTSDELIELFMNLEDEIEKVERLIQIRTKVQIYREEVRRYEAAIEELIKMNTRLGSMVKGISCKAEKNHLLENDPTSPV